MLDKYNVGEDILTYLRNHHTGAKNAAPSAVIEHVFCLTGPVVRQMVNKLRCDGRPVCSDANGYFYARTRDEVNDTITRLLSRTKKINDAAQGLVLSHQIFHDGTEGGL
jgi:hypothetical protein